MTPDLFPTLFADLTVRFPGAHRGDDFALTSRQMHRGQSL